MHIWLDLGRSVMFWLAVKLLTYLLLSVFPILVALYGVYPGGEVHFVYR
jgi:hypothetical protein